MDFNWLWGYFIPVGFLLLTWGGYAPQRARRVTPLAALALALSIIGYWAVGYGLHLGGAGVIAYDNPALANLDKLYGNSTGFGLFGMTGFALTWEQGEPVSATALDLFLAYLPLIATAVLLVTLALAETRRWLMVAVAALSGALVVPIGACWAWGSGWLSQLGATLGLGHGFVDAGGSGVVLWLPAMLATGLLLLHPRATVEADPGPPPAYFPLLANLGGVLLGIGWIGWTLAAPLHTYGAALHWQRAAINVFLGMAGAVLTSQLYAWLIVGEVEPLIAARGQAAGWAVALAGAPFLPAWAALMLGLLAGLAFPLLLYMVEVGLRLKDTAATIALGGVAGLLGLLGPALLADGRAGMGWNGIGAMTSAMPRGVTGLLAGGGAGQLQAQLVGLLALGAWGLLWGLLLGAVNYGVNWLNRPRAPHAIEAEPANPAPLEAEADAIPAAPGVTQTDEGIAIETMPEQV